MELFFEKWHGCKNDFILIWSTTNQLQYVKDSLRRRAPLICSKKGDGIGADGIIICETQLTSDLYPKQIHVINRDGSEAKNCGNGLRCAAMSTKKRLMELHKEASILEDALELIIKDRAFLCRFLENKNTLSEDQRVYFPSVTIHMESPLLDEKAHKQWNEVQRHINQLLQKEGKNLQVEDWNLCQLGNLHLILFCNIEPQESEAFAFAASLQSCSFWDGVNVHLVSTSSSSHLSADVQSTLQKAFDNSLGDEILKTLVWERGVGPTPACGSGAASIGAAYFQKGFTSEQSWLPIQMPGGLLYVRPSDQSGQTIVLAGPALFVFKGSFFI